MTDGHPIRYRDTGVDLDAAERAKRGIKDLLASTSDANTLSELGLFGGLYRVPRDIDRPVLVSSADGVGTKLKVAFAAERHDTVGRDLVNHCVNDILVQGARPLFFLDYLATGDLDERVVESVVEGIALGCRENGLALLGGETAQMPDFYSEGEYDLAGFIVGVVPESGILDGRRIRSGDRLVAIGSSGLHTNGYTLARHIVFERMGLDVGDPFPDSDASVADVLLTVHRSYLPSLRPMLEGNGLHGLAHITGGGIPGNLPRILPDGLGARVDRSSWVVPPLFQRLQREGDVERDEMFRVFNMGVGMIAVVESARESDFIAALRAEGETAWSCGQIEAGSGVQFVD
jgi:phosphoribosylformylglycinamidine cyclo-ligase